VTTDDIIENILTRVYGNTTEKKNLKQIRCATCYERTANENLYAAYDDMAKLVEEEKRVFDLRFGEPEERISSPASYEMNAERRSDEANAKAFRDYYYKQKELDLWRSYFDIKKEINQLKFIKRAQSIEEDKEPVSIVQGKEAISAQRKE
jgi:hypothetical protein